MIAYLFIDIGATKIAWRVRTLECVSNGSVVLPRLADPEQELFSVINHIKTTSKIDHFSSGIVAAAPTINSSGVISHWPNRPHWRSFDILAFLKTQLGCDFIAEDDGCAAALAVSEKYNITEVLYLSVGTGVGGAIVKQGRVVRTNKNQVIEFGHMPVNIFGETCACGSVGCFQQYVSGKAILSSVFKQNYHDKSHADLYALFNAESAETVGVINKASHYFAQFILMILGIYSLDLIVVGGGFICRFPVLLDRTKEIIYEKKRDGLYVPPLKLMDAVSQPVLDGAEIVLRNKMGELLYDV